MKRFVLAVFLTMSALAFMRAQTPAPYKVVFDLTSRDSLDHKAVMRWIREISTAHPDAQMELVMYGKGLELVMPEKSTYGDAVADAMKNPNVSFAVCAMAMKNNNVEKSQLLPGVRVVPDGIYEIISKQAEHWGYIKVTH